MRKIGAMTMVLALAVGSGGLLAQGRGPGRPAGGFGAAPGAAQAPKVLLQLEGQVREVNPAGLRGAASILVGGDTVLLGPPFHLLRHGFTVESGDWIRAEVFESPARPGTLVATKVLNVTRDQRVELRDETGLPVWAAGARRWARGGIGRGPCGGAARDVEAMETFAGGVSEVDTESFPRFPRITLDSGPTFAAGPYRLWLDQDFTASAGDSLNVRAYPCAFDADRWVAVEIENLTTGETLRLRDEEGFPPRPRERGAQRRDRR